MSASQRLHVDLADIVALRMECVKCKAAISLKPPLEGRFDKCPACGEAWPGRDDGVQVLMKFLNAARDGDVNSHAWPYRLQFEIEQP